MLNMQKGIGIFEKSIFCCKFLILVPFGIFSSVNSITVLGSQFCPLLFVHCLAIETTHVYILEYKCFSFSLGSFTDNT